MSAPPPPSGPVPKGKPSKVFVTKEGPSLEEILKKTRDQEPKVIIDKEV
jgi:hypothetical protein